MDTHDIKGAKTGTKWSGNFHSRERKDFIDINNTSEVPGAQVGSLKKGLTTNRIINPLSPTYKYLGATELGAIHINDPYASNGAGSSMDNKYMQIQK